MAKKGYVQSSLEGLRAFTQAMTTLKGARVDVGFFAGEAQRGDETPARAAARSKRMAKYIGAGSKPGFFKPGVEFAKRRAKVASLEGEDRILTNPEIAAKNEFGVGVPRRSMLRMPLHLHGDRVLKDAKVDATVQFKEVARAPVATAKRFLKRLGIAGENLVQEAFDTRGFGSWKPNAPLTIALKRSDAPLIDKGELRRAVDSRVVV